MSKQQDNLRRRFNAETGKHSFDTQFGASLDYAVWLEKKIISSNLPVSGRSELLLSFIKWWIGKNKRHDTHQTLEEIVEEFIKTKQ